MARMRWLPVPALARQKGRLTGWRIRRRFAVTRIAVLALLALFAAVAILSAGRFAAHQAFAEVYAGALETLNVQTATLDGVLDKYRVLPPLLAQGAEFRRFFVEPAGPGSGADVAGMRIAAESVVGLSGALDLLLIDPAGAIFHAARGRLSETRGRLEEAIAAARQGRLGRQSLVLPDGERAYVFVAPVRRGDSLGGFIALVVDLENVEATWALSKNTVYVTDRSGRIFLSNRRDWRMARPETVTAGAGARGREPLDLTRGLPLLEWQIHVLADTAAVAEARLGGQTVAGLVSLVLAGIAVIALRRREVGILRERRDRALALRLERVVRDRTRALSQANLFLKDEVEERRLTEAKLRRTQDELVQAAKLASLGQMAAALGHEFNQPLAAIRTYADNAERFLSRERADMASGNLKRIVAMTDRMAEMSKTLLAFARKPGTASNPVALGPILDEAMILVRPRLRKAGIALTVDPALRQVTVMGGRVRLAQVFVNLVNNAVDAMSGTGAGPGAGAGRGDAVSGSGGEAAGAAGGRIAIGLGPGAGSGSGSGGPGGPGGEAAPGETAPGMVEIRVADDGPGILPAMQDQIFEPFVTTKASGEGIGIGLSIVRNILADFGGTIRLVASGPGGSEFAIVLVSADTGETVRDPFLEVS
ncbi:ATP-binding protein [Aurantimonas sp. 22II-16-19i]|uniref:sensor histidine kinase n=1 Tax=Aurantimonas sp. 22II-16-19i TaxID=1317114 RepID=UPI00159419A5|nr:ATP-binding protein [Aurantimonas sp. 22II-16-19i]